MEVGIANVDSAMKAASLDWNVVLESMFLKNGKTVPNRKAVVRDSDGDVLATVSNDYKIIQYSDAFRLFQPSIDEFGMTIEAAGALGNGERAWMLFRLPTVLTPIAGDDINGYGVAVTGHDGKTIYQFRPTPVRVVCQNTLDAALGASTGTGNLNGTVKGRVFSIMHSGNVKDEIKQARSLVVNVMSAMKETGETFASMARKALTPDQVKEYVETVFPALEGKLTDPIVKKRSEVLELVWNGVGAELARSETNGKPNPWAVYNAVTEWADHVAPAAAKTPKAARRLAQSAIFGSAADLKLLALRQAQRLVMA
jgi:phage/plasmid-like protein (TIGR03299 family)